MVVAPHVTEEGLYEVLRNVIDPEIQPMLMVAHQF